MQTDFGRKGSTVGTVVAAIVLVLAMVTGVVAQTSRGTIAGTVVDPSDAVISGATIKAQEKATGETRTTSTGGSGGFRLDAVSPGIYTIEVSASGFAPMKVQDVTVAGSVVTPLTIKMHVGTTEVVNVEANAEKIQTESGELSKTIDAKQVVDLPIASNNAYALATTLAGVIPPSSRDDFTNGTGFSVNGLRPRANNFLIDGFDNNDNAIQGQALQPQNQEAVEQVTVLTNSYSSEFGRGGASVSNVVFKSGTNSIHGGAWEEYQGSRLDALSTSQAKEGITRVPQYVQNLFGFRLGMPIIKNKLFVFGTSQWQRFYGAFSGSSLTVPTAAGVTTLQAIAAASANPLVAPNINLLIDTLGGIRGISGITTVNLGSRPDCPANPCLIERGRFTRFQSAAAPSYEWTVRVDYVPSSSDNFMVRYTGTHSALTPDLFANSSSFPGMDSLQGGPARNLGVLWTHLFSNRAANELRFSAQQINFTFDATPETQANPLSTQPRISVPVLTTFGGLNSALPQFRGHRVYQLEDAVIITFGKHALKVGADVVHLEIGDGIPFNSRGTLSVTSGGACNTVAFPYGQASCASLNNYIDGFSGPAGTISLQFGNPVINVPWTQQSYYAQDTWKVLSNLTLDFGVRYEYQSPAPNNVLPFPSVVEPLLGTPYTQPFPTKFPVHPDRNNFGPRVGFAYSPRFARWLFGENKTVIRGGFGVFYDTFFTNINDNTAASSPNTLGGTLTGASAPSRGTANARGQFLLITPSVNKLNTITTVVQGLKNPRTYQWNFGFQRELPWGNLLEVAYVGTRGLHLFANEQFNPRLNGGARISPTYGSIVARANHGNSSYNGLDVTVSHRFSHGLQLRGAYTYSHSLDNISEVFVTSGGASRRQNVFSYQGDRGNSAFDRTHRGVITWIYAIPYPKGKSVLTAVTRDWEVSGSAQWQSGVPQSVFFGGFDQNGDGEAFNDRPIDGNPAVAINFSDTCVTSATVCSGFADFDGVTYFDDRTGAVGVASDFRYILDFSGTFPQGNVGRNTLRNPGFQNWDLAIARRIKVPIKGLEGQQFTFKVEMFNAWNHPNKGLNGGITGDLFSNSFADTAETQDGNRNIRLWIKWTF